MRQKYEDLSVDVVAFQFSTMAEVCSWKHYEAMKNEQRGDPEHLHVRPGGNDRSNTSNLECYIAISWILNQFCIDILRILGCEIFADIQIQAPSQTHTFRSTSIYIRRY